MKFSVICLGIAAALCLVGCSAVNGPNENAGKTGEVPLSSAKTASAPPSGYNGGGVVIKPADPNNPVFKADPKLAGGH